MSPPTTPYSQLTDPNDLALSDEDEGSRSSAEATRSPSTLGDVDPLISRSYEDEKTQQSMSSNQGRLQIIGWMIANTMATVGSVRSGSKPSSRELLDHALTVLQVFINKTLFSNQCLDTISSALQHIILPLQASCSAYFQIHDSVTSRQDESRSSRCCRYVYHCV